MTTEQLRTYLQSTLQIPFVTIKADKVSDSIELWSPALKYGFTTEGQMMRSDLQPIPRVQNQLQWIQDVVKEKYADRIQTVRNVRRMQLGDLLMNSKLLSYDLFPENYYHTKYDNNAIKNIDIGDKIRSAYEREHHEFDIDDIIRLHDYIYDYTSGTIDNETFDAVEKEYTFLFQCFYEYDIQYYGYRGQHELPVISDEYIGTLTTDPTGSFILRLYQSSYPFMLNDDGDGFNSLLFMLLKLKAQIKVGADLVHPKKGIEWLRKHKNRID